MTVVELDDCDRRVVVGPEHCQYAVAVKVSDHRMDFTVWSLVGSDGEPERMADGHVKWDHCSNINYDYTESCMIHFCEAEHMRAYHKAVEMAYELAAELIPRWDSA